MEGLKNNILGPTAIFGQELAGEDHFSLIEGLCDKQRAQTKLLKQFCANAML